MTTETYPEHQKLRAIADRSQAIGEFLDWMGHQGFWLHDRDGFEPHGSVQDWLARYFDIDRDKIEAEKRAMLEALRAAQS